MAYYDVLDDPIVEYYVEKIKCVVANQRFQSMMKQLITGVKKTGYRYGQPTTPFGFLLQEMRVKLKPKDKRSVFKHSIRNLRDCLTVEQTVKQLMARVSNRFDRITPAMLQDIEDDNDDLESRLEARSSALMMATIREQFGEFDESQVVLSPKLRTSSKSPDKIRSRESTM